MRMAAREGLGGELRASWCLVNALRVQAASECQAELPKLGSGEATPIPAPDFVMSPDEHSPGPEIFNPALDHKPCHKWLTQYGPKTKRVVEEHLGAGLQQEAPEQVEHGLRR
jgi:hypothetical protein